ncbi:hypothetical protein B0H15DRAFT_801415 [Mycena belliarum]|uniref:Uncharacterized protein n=1 Tax=Mycena belliarum TaxID=1033014 RepID=A0AAD6XRH1_9AGAR|nr:hypothetical protein B0H15DRAFT_801415 [Mycena belliae]
MSFPTNARDFLRNGCESYFLKDYFLQLSPYDAFGKAPKPPPFAPHLLPESDEFLEDLNLSSPEDVNSVFWFNHWAVSQLFPYFHVPARYPCASTNYLLWLLDNAAVVFDTFTQFHDRTPRSSILYRLLGAFSLLFELIPETARKHVPEGSSDGVPRYVRWNRFLEPFKDDLSFAGIPVNFWLPRLHHAIPTEFEQFYFDPESLELFKDIPQSSAVSELVPFLSFRGDVKAHVREHTQELVKLLQAAHADLKLTLLLQVRFSKRVDGLEGCPSLVARFFNALNILVIGMKEAGIKETEAGPFDSFLISYITEAFNELPLGFRLPEANEEHWTPYSRPFPTMGEILARRFPETAKSPSPAPLSGAGTPTFGSIAAALPPDSLADNEDEDPLAPSPSRRSSYRATSSKISSVPRLRLPSPVESEVSVPPISSIEVESSRPRRKLPNVDYRAERHSNRVVEKMDCVELSPRARVKKPASRPKIKLFTNAPSVEPPEGELPVVEQEAAEESDEPEDTNPRKRRKGKGKAKATEPASKKVKTVHAEDDGEKGKRRGKKRQSTEAVLYPSSKKSGRAAASNKATYTSQEYVTEVEAAAVADALPAYHKIAGPITEYGCVACINFDRKCVPRGVMQPCQTCVDKGTSFCSHALPNYEHMRRINSLYPYARLGNYALNQAADAVLKDRAALEGLHSLINDATMRLMMSSYNLGALVQQHMEAFGPPNIGSLHGLPDDLQEMYNRFLDVESVEAMLPYATRPDIVDASCVRSGALPDDPEGMKELRKRLLQYYHDNPVKESSPAPSAKDVTPPASEQASSSWPEVAGPSRFEGAMEE